MFCAICVGWANGWRCGVLVIITAIDSNRYAIEYDYDEQVTALLKTAVPSYARQWNRQTRGWIIDTIYPLRCFIEALRYRGHDIVGDVPDMPTCRECGAAISQRNIIGLCLECRLIAHNERMSSQADTAEPVSRDEALQNVTAVLGGRIISDTNRKGNHP